MLSWAWPWDAQPRWPWPGWQREEAASAALRCGFPPCDSMTMTLMPQPSRWPTRKIKWNLNLISDRVSEPSSWLWKLHWLWLH